MSRSGYSDDCWGWGYICWRGAVNSAMNGKRGQAFLKEMLKAMDTLPEKRLIANDLERNGEYCALGAVGHLRGLDMSNIDPDDAYQVSNVFNIAPAMAKEIVYMNDEGFSYYEMSPEKRFAAVRKWIESLIIKEDGNGS